MSSCVFCAIVAGKLPAFVIEENERVIVFLSLENHPLIVTKRHVADIYALDEALGAAVMRETIRVARAVKAGLECEGVFLAQANEPAAGQDVFHFHLHVYPRWRDKGLNGCFAVEQHDHAAKEAIARQIRQQLAALP